MSSYGSQHAFPQQSPYSPYPQPGSNYFPPTTQQPPPPGAVPMPIPQRPRQYSHSSHPPSSYGSHHSNGYNNAAAANSSYPPSPAQPFVYSTSPQMASSYLAPSDAAAQSQAITAPAYTQTHSYQQQPLPNTTMAVAHAPHYDRRSSQASHHSHRSRHHNHHHDEDDIDDSSRDTSTDSAEDRRYERAERKREHRPSVGEAVYRTFKYLGGLLDPKRT